MASIYKRGENQWEVKVRRKGYPSQTQTFETKARARAWATKVEAEMQGGTFLSRKVAEQTTLRQLVNRYIEDVTPTHKGWQSEEIRLSKLSRHKICECAVANLTPAMIASYRDERLKSVVPATAVRELTFIQQIITHAMREWDVVLPVNPATLVKRPRVSNERSRRLRTAAQLGRSDGASEEDLLMKACACDPGSKRGGCRNDWLLPIVILAIETAMRRGEILSIEWQHVNLGDGLIYLPDTKNGTSRHVPLSSRARQTLEGLGLRTIGRVFDVTADALKLSWTRAVVRAGIEDLHFHDLRHEATSRLAERLSNVLELSAVTGHKDLRMVKRYYHPDPLAIARKLASPKSGDG